MKHLHCNHYHHELMQSMRKYLEIVLKMYCQYMILIVEATGTIYYTPKAQKHIEWSQYLPSNLPLKVIEVFDLVCIAAWNVLLLLICVIDDVNAIYVLNWTGKVQETVISRFDHWYKIPRYYTPNANIWWFPPPSFNTYTDELVK